ncbi:unnamed protein product [Arabidopsis halleri]
MLSYINKIQRKKNVEKNNRCLILKKKKKTHRTKVRTWLDRRINCDSYFVSVYTVLQIVNSLKRSSINCE